MGRFHLQIIAFGDALHLNLTTLGFFLSFWAYPPFFFCPYPGLFFITNNQAKPFLFLSALFLYPCPHIIQISTIWCSQLNTILSPDSFPFVSLPTDYQLELPDILRSEILDQSISLRTIIHIFCYNTIRNLIFLSLMVSFSLSIYHFRGRPRAPFLKSFFFANQLPATPYKPSLCLLFTGAWHAPVIRSSPPLPTKVLMHSTYPNTLVLPFPVLLGWCCFECCI